MKKKLLVSVLVIAVAISAIAGGTLAWFTDTDTTPTNKFVAGILSMDVDDVFNYEDNTYDDFTPGDNINKLVQITNNGTKREFLRVQITETRVLKMHYNLADLSLVEYLHALDSSNVSTNLPGTFAAKMVGGQWIVEYNVDGNPIAFGAPGYGAADGFTEIYVTNFGGYAASAWTGENGTTDPAYAPAVKYLDSSNHALGTGPIPGASIDVYRELPQAQWATTTTNLRDMADIAWYIDATNLFANGLWSNIGNFWYFNQALYPAGYDLTPADGNDNSAFPATVAPLLNSVEFVPSANDNIYQGSVYTIDFTFETIQVTNGAAAAAWGVAFSQDLTTNLAADVLGTWA